VFLRLIVWIVYKLTPNHEYYHGFKDTVRFVLDHPRRVYTNLFPSNSTWWLAFVVLVLNSIDWAAFELLNIGNNNLADIPRHYRVLDGLFQAIAIRSGGFSVVSISTLRIGLQVLYVLMMYISVYPVVITMRNSNVYEERSLGIFAEDTMEDDKKSAKSGWLGYSSRNTRRYFLRQQLRNQLAHDLWWIMVSILFISCIEVANFERDPVTYSVFNIAFEVVSAYGCVGVSTGLPNESYSFSGGWHICSKLILVAVMLRGRHRGLPVAIDRAVLLPGETLSSAEEEDWRISRGAENVDEAV
jgi:potassium uptake Trk family protein